MQNLRLSTGVPNTPICFPFTSLLKVFLCAACHCDDGQHDEPTAAGCLKKIEGDLVFGNVN